MDLGKWDIISGIRLHDIHGYFCGLMVKSMNPRILRCHAQYDIVYSYFILFYSIFHSI